MTPPSDSPDYWKTRATQLMIENQRLGYELGRAQAKLSERPPTYDEWRNEATREGIDRGLAAVKEDFDRLKAANLSLHRALSHASYRANSWASTARYLRNFARMIAHIRKHGGKIDGDQVRDRLTAVLSDYNVTKEKFERASE